MEKMGSELISCVSSSSNSYLFAKTDYFNRSGTTRTIGCCNNIDRTNHRIYSSLVNEKTS